MAVVSSIELRKGWYAQPPRLWPIESSAKTKIGGALPPNSLLSPNENSGRTQQTKLLFENQTNITGSGLLPQLRVLLTFYSLLE
ncbi:MAG: hypothetical protein COV47_04035 [Candidatus Diapherotrites archaeon CG11_big_fil_rev_8_21_14_0_20_37_9]|nr:MAG: hypothetical protein COV47_04035 [Candidatus Diapherotrites archaeon CG11_big_fil_rev_8_21_14_0_20_37_9]